MIYLKLSSGDIVYTNIPLNEVRLYIRNMKVGEIRGFLDTEMTKEIYVSVRNICFASQESLT